MKHVRNWIAALLAVGMLTGCAVLEKPPKTFTLPPQYQLTARLSYRGLDAQIRLRREEGRDILEFESPEGLRGLRLTLDPGVTKLDYGTMERRFTRSSLPETSVAQLLLTTLNDANANGIPKDGLCQGPWGEYTLQLDETGSKILKLSIPRQSLDLQVQNFEILYETE